MSKKPLLKLCVQLALFSLLLVQCKSDPYLQLKQRYSSFQLLTEFSGFHAPRWSPDGTQLIFYDLAGSIVISKNDGSHRQPINDTTQPGQTPDWSPDGKRIVFTSKRGGSSEIYIMNVDGNDPVQLTHTGYTGVPKWSPDGKRIAFFQGEGKSAETGIYLMDPDGTNTTRLTRYPLMPDLAFEWSPDSTHIAFTAVDESSQGESQPTISSQDKNPRVYTIKADGSNLLLVTKDMSGASFPIWSPDGEQILFNISSPGGFFLINADGSQLRRVLDGLGCVMPHWSRTNNRLICMCMRSFTVSELCTIDMKEALK